jgi:hypothetical protein
MVKRSDCAMHLTPPVNHAAALRLILLWGALTGVYMAAVLYRIIAMREPVALPTYAGFTAVAAVWFALADAVHPRDLWGASAITSLLASIALNAAIIARAYMISRTIPGLRIVFTLVLFAGLISTTLHAERHLNHKDKE